MNGAVSKSPNAKVFVISDVHIGAGELDDFAPDIEARLLQFLDWLAQLPDAVELVINGDFFDFATAEPWDNPQLESTTHDGLPLCFTEEQSGSKLEEIIAAHGPVFDSLAKLLESNLDNTITILPGNHDADLFWPKVRQRIYERLAASAGANSDAVTKRFVFMLERKYVLEKWGHRYWIEHGHQHDPPNSFFPNGEERWSAAAPPIFLDTDKQPRLYECPGTLGLVRYLNRWRRKYHSLSYIKPYSRIMLALITFNAFREPGRPILVLRHLASMLWWDVDLKTALNTNDDIEAACHQALEDLLRNLSKDEEKTLIYLLGQQGTTISGPLANLAKTKGFRKRVLDSFAAELADNGFKSGIQVTKEQLGFVRNGFLKDVETKALAHMARKLIEEGKAEYVLTGHTHDPCQTPDGGFSNGGCWIPNQDLDSLADAKRLIFEDGPVHFRMNYLEIDSAGPPKLHEFDRGFINI